MESSQYRGGILKEVSYERRKKSIQRNILRLPLLRAALVLWYFCLSAHERSRREVQKMFLKMEQMHLKSCFESESLECFLEG